MKPRPGQLIRIKPGSPAVGWFIPDQNGKSTPPFYSNYHYPMMYIRDEYTSFEMFAKHQVIKTIIVLHRGKLCQIQVDPKHIEILSE